MELVGSFHIVYNVEEGQIIATNTSSELTCWADGDSPEVDLSKVFIKHIPIQATTTELTAICAAQGQLTSFSLVRNSQTGTNGGFAFATYATEDEAQSAWPAINGMPLYDKHLKAAPARHRMADLTNTNLHVNGLPRIWTVREAWNYFQNFGKPVAIKILLDEATGMSRGIGILVMTSKTEAQLIKTHCSGLVLPGGCVPLILSDAESKGPKPAYLLGNVTRTRALFVGNMRPTENLDFLRGLFSPFGVIDSIHIKATGRFGPGFAFVNMRNANEALAAVAALHNFQISTDRCLTVQPKKTV